MDSRICAPASNIDPETSDEYRCYFQSIVNLDRTLPRPGWDLRFSDSGGHGHAVVVSHGAGADHAMFHAQARAALDAGFRIISYDLRGHGESVLDDGIRFRAEDAIDDLVSLIGHLELEQPRR